MVVDVRMVSVVPAMAMNVVVVGVVVFCRACWALVGIVGRHHPTESRAAVRGLES